MSQGVTSRTHDFTSRVRHSWTTESDRIGRFWIALRKISNGLVLVGAVASMFVVRSFQLQLVVAAGAILFSVAAILHHFRWGLTPAQPSPAQSRWIVGTRAWPGLAYVALFGLAYAVLGWIILLRVLDVISDPEIAAGLAGIDILNVTLLFNSTLVVGYLALAPWLLLLIALVVAASVYGLFPWLLVWIGAPVRYVLARTGLWPYLALVPLTLVFVTRSAVLGAVFQLATAFILIVAWSDILWRNRERMLRRWPQLEQIIFSRPGSPYLAGSVLGLLVCALLMAGPLAKLAEPLGTLVYLMLWTALLFETGAFLAGRRKTETASGSTP